MSIVRIRAKSRDAMLEEIRAKRNALLRESDWTQIGDADLTGTEKAAWVQYRKALRDLTKSDDLAAITWPKAPA